MALSDSKFSPQQWANAPAFNGGSVQTADAGTAEVLDQEKGELSGDPAFADDVKGLDRERARLDPSVPSANANKLLKLVGGGGGGDAASAAPSDNASKLLQMVQGDANQDSYDRGKVPPVKDSERDSQDLYDKTASPIGGWSRTVQKALSGTPLRYLGDATRNVSDAMTPRGAAAAGRGALTHALGFGGTLEKPFYDANEGLRGVPDHADPAMRGHETTFPTPDEVSQGLTKIGMPPDPYRQGIEQAGGIVTDLAIPGAQVAATRAPRTSAAARLVDEARAPIEGAAREGQMNLRNVQIPEEPRLPAEQTPQYPGPGATSPVPVSPYTPRAVPRTAPDRLSTELEGHLSENEQRLRSEKGARWDQYQQDLAGEDGDVPIDHVLDKWQSAGATSGKTTRSTIGNFTEEIKDIQNNPDMNYQQRLKAYHDLKRRVASAAQGDASGFGALDKTMKGDMARDLTEAMNDASPAYKDFAKDYRELSNESEPLDRSFMHQGESEGTTRMDAVFKDPKNVDSAIGAMGPGGATKLDALGVRHVENKLGRLSGQKLEDAANDLGPKLAQLPQTRARVTELLNADQMGRANEGLVKKLMEDHSHVVEGQTADWSARKTEAQQLAALGNKQAKEGFDAATKTRETALAAKAKAEDTARGYTPVLNKLQTTEDASQRVKYLQQLVDKMHGDKLISDAEHLGYQQQIERAAKAVKKDDQLGTLSKYLLYSLTGNYMVSFGGPHLYDYVTK